MVPAGSFDLVLVLEGLLYRDGWCAVGAMMMVGGATWWWSWCSWVGALGMVPVGSLILALLMGCLYYGTS